MSHRANRIVVAGGGVAGLATALLLARDGREVVVIERDELDSGVPENATEWPRKGIAHFRQPHAFIPRGRQELAGELPDVYGALLRVGAHDVDLRQKLPGEVVVGDESLQYLAVRRPLIEWALRRAVAAEPRIAVHANVRVEGLVVEAGSVRGVRVSGATLDGALVVDAMGRRSATVSWLSDAGQPQEPSESSDCGVTYFSRYYRARPGHTLPDGPWLLSPRGDLGYLAYASFPGDNGAFAALLAAPPGVPEWRAFQDAAVFEAAIARIPALASLKLAGAARSNPLVNALPLSSWRPGVVSVWHHSHTLPVMS